ncbi:dTMP kinase [Candidatus Woesearchaeota archaeon]|nr:dTMP kinase [Candidatus Woesearchaeota archaeon]
MEGKLIVIEGNDSSGKQTQTDLLIKQLSAKGFKVKEADFPQYYTSHFGELIAKYLRGELGDIKHISPYFSTLLYAQDRFEAKKKLRNWLKKGNIVISNRYVPSNKAYGAARLTSKKEQSEFIAWIDTLEYKINKIPRPDLIVYLKVPLQIAQDWITTKKKRDYLKGEEKDIHEKNLNYLKNVEKIYDSLSENENWAEIDCIKQGRILNEQEIHKKVWKVIKNRIIPQI